MLTDLLFAWNGIGSLIEGFADITLMHGFLPYKDITVIGVGWALGIIFCFYLLFPFFVFLIWDKRRAWLSLFVATVLSYISLYYFESDNFLCYFFYFVTGGLLYLYRDPIRQKLSKHVFVMRALCILATFAWFLAPTFIQLPAVGTITISGIKTLLLFTVWMLYAISTEDALLNNRITKFISGISFEIYLAHMAVFRVLEKIDLTQVSENNVVSYIVATTLTIGGVMSFAFVYHQVVILAKTKLAKTSKK